MLQLPNGVSIVLGVAFVAALTAIAGALPGQVPGWTGLALAALIGGIAKAIQVWADSYKPLPDMLHDVDADGDVLTIDEWSSPWRHWLIG